VVFECQREGCGGDPNRATSGGGGRMSLAQNFLYEAEVKEPTHSNGACALTSRIDDQRYLTAEIPQAEGSAWVSVHTYQLNPNSYCKALSGRTMALVHVVEPKAREQKMVVVPADQMASTIDAEGSIALYGIYFDTNEARLRLESEPTLQQIAKLLSAQPQLAVVVVGHTDNEGSFEHNLNLSTRRAQAVKAALATRPGVDARRLTAAGAGMMAPVATNNTEAGRAKNRRVGLVRASAP
jgi:OOP family OmpA-OmpF porin